MVLRLGSIEHLGFDYTGGGTFFKVGGVQVHVKTIEKFCGFNWQL